MKASQVFLFIGMATATALTFIVPPAEGFQEPNLARIIFFHLPCAFLTSGLLFLAAWHGLKFLTKREPERDIRLAATLELGALMGVLTMATGILFSKVQWGAWWQWDPRQTSFLMVLLILAVGLSVRAGLVDEKVRAVVSSAYSIIAVIPATFLIFVFPRLPHVQQASFHPSTTIQKGSFDANYWMGLLAVFAMLTWLLVVIYRTRVRVGCLELQLETYDGNLDDLGDGATPSGVVRPVSVSRER